jgi:sarcosine oxidase subunit beta
MARTAEAIVVGAGAIGASTAHFLAEKGMKDVLLIDKAGPAGGTTGLSVALTRFNYSNYGSAALAYESYKIFHDWENRIGGASGFRPVGLIHIANEERIGWVRSQVEYLHREFSDEISMISADDCKELQPFMYTDDIVGASYQPNSGHTTSTEAINSLVQRGLELGMKTEMDMRVLGVKVQDGRAVGVETDSGDIDSPIVILATGSWTAPLAQTAGVDVPIKGGRLSAGLLERPADLGITDHMAITDSVAGGYWRPDLPGMTMIGITFPEQDYHWPEDPDTHNTLILQEEMLRAARSIAHRFPGMDRAGWARTWTCVDGFTPDHQMILGETDEVPGLWIAAGGNGHGFKTGPATGILMAEQVIDGEVKIIKDMSEFRYDRFGDDPWEGLEGNFTGRFAERRNSRFGIQQLREEEGMEYREVPVSSLDD